MKKLMTLLLTVSLLFNLAACGDGTSEPEIPEPEIPEDARYPEAWSYFAKLHYGDYMFRDYGIDDIIGEDEDGELYFLSKKGRRFERLEHGLDYTIYEGEDLKLYITGFGQMKYGQDIVIFWIKNRTGQDIEIGGTIELAGYCTVPEVYLDGEWWECKGAIYAGLATAHGITLQQGYEDVNQFKRWACSGKTYEENGVFRSEYSRLPDGRYRIIFRLAPWSDSVLTAEYEIKDGEFIW